MNIIIVLHWEREYEPLIELCALQNLTCKEIAWKRRLISPHAVCRDAWQGPVEGFLAFSLLACVEYSFYTGWVYPTKPVQNKTGYTFHPQVFKKVLIHPSIT